MNSRDVMIGLYLCISTIYNKTSKRKVNLQIVVTY